MKRTVSVERQILEPERPLQSLDPMVVDARGHRCPVPTLRLRRALAVAAPGQAVRLLADDPMARIDVPHFAAQNGLKLLASTDEGQWMSFLVGAAPD
jgi:tRNA 2-thiouridine synthesizing protein A